ncbi:Fic family protein [Fluviispira vulneris]|uniref:Fic family protein n=1 Tax=Fluviispira vulneris TaxID=2763012 RepID=UPI0016493EAC|nr:Fic family protein [Fluviispira vulneris]
MKVLDIENNEENDFKNRAGKYVSQITTINGAKYKAFIPKPLPPSPPLNYDLEMISLLSKADLALGRLNGLASIIADPDIFVYLYVRKEALLSSQIEGTQCSLEDILSVNETMEENNADVEEVSNYVYAMNQGLSRLKDLPISTRLIKEIHNILLKGVRGSKKTPGEFRTNQNWIGNINAKLNNADFIPPPPDEVNKHMSELEKFIHSQNDLPYLVKAALIHAQFETIHPFLDGNGRLGRLLITFVLCSWDVMEKPLLYLSYFFKAHRTEYYSKLMDIRNKGDWEGWIKFFLRGVAETAEMANFTAIEIHKIHNRDLAKISANKPTPMMNQIFHQLCCYPIVSVPILERHINGSSQATIQRALVRLKEIGIITEITGLQRNRKYAYLEYLNILKKDTTTRIG